VWLGLAIIAAMAYLGHYAWQQHAPAVRRHPDYAITPERIHISPQPPWIRADIRKEVVRTAQLAGDLSLLDDGESLQQIKKAFESHPWVIEVHRVSKRLPAGVDVELDYRRPAAAIETVGPQRMQLLVVDRSGVRLPENDLNEAERRYLPRITGVGEQPPVGEPWTDQRVTAAVRLAVGLADVWRSLRLVEIVPQNTAFVSGGSVPMSFTILTSGGTRVVWGSAPGDEQPGESAFAAKLQLLESYAAQKGDLGSIYGPKELDVRRQLRIEPRAARKPGDKTLADDAKSADEDQPEEEVAARNDEETVDR
jgi:hypothetical protein